LRERSETEAVSEGGVIGRWVNFWSRWGGFGECCLVKHPKLVDRVINE
jgi:hypothetical protein